MPRQSTILPDGCIDVIWQTGVDPFVAGPMTIPVGASTPTGIISVGVRFRPGAATALLGIPASELRDLRVPLTDIWSTGRQPSARLRAPDDAGPSLALAVDEVSAQIQWAAPPDRFIMDACGWLAHHPGAPIAAFTAGSGVSERHARRRFLEHIGYGPKMLQRVLRLQRVLWLLSQPSPPDTLAHLALAAGYADQAHLTRETRALTGQLPTTLATGVPRSAVADLFKTPPV